MAFCSYKLRKTLWRHLRDLLIVVAVGDLVTLLFNPHLESYLYNFWWNSFYSLMIGGLLWKGNEAVGYFVSKKIDKNKQPGRALVWNLISMTIYSISAIVLFNLLWWHAILKRPLDFFSQTGLLIIVIQFVITIIIASILYSRGYFIAWRESAVNEERLKKESIRLQYNALKNQVNPHFLFNSLNSLTSLVHDDPDLAAKFIKQLSDIYRYVLEHKDNELVALKDEIQFCQRYIFLQQIRSGAYLKVSFQVDKLSGISIVPVSLQILIENAIKHNEASSAHPLSIQIFSKGAYIVVQNKKQKRTSMIESGGTGLKTLQNRYAFLTDKKMIIEDSPDEFLVKIPFIQIDHT